MTSLTIHSVHFHSNLIPKFNFIHFQDVKDSADKKSYEFWSTQPVPKLDEDITTNEAIEPDVPLENMRHEPYSLPAGFQWDTLNLDDPIVVNILVFYCFRKQILHYVFIVTPAKGQLISKGLFGVIVWTKKPTNFF